MKKNSERLCTLTVKDRRDVATQTTFAVSIKEIATLMKIAKVLDSFVDQTIAWAFQVMTGLEAIGTLAQIVVKEDALLSIHVHWAKEIATRTTIAMTSTS